MVRYYARLSGGGGHPILPVFKTDDIIMWGDDCEPGYTCTVVYDDLRDGEVPYVPHDGIFVPFDFINKRCAPIGEDTAHRLAPGLFA